MEERFFWLPFSVAPGIGPARFSGLLRRFGSAKDAWFSLRDELKEVLGETLSLKFADFRKKFSLAGYLKQLERKGVSFLILTDKDYPQPLARIEKPPFVLYYKGKAGLLNGQSIAVVGTRKITSYGEEATKLLVSNLVANGFTIVSGLALGVDAVSHKEALEQKGDTIAVLGCGIDCCTPLENQGIYNSIIKSGGCIVSEYPLGEPPTKGSFPARNRIIAGLSQAVLVTEGAEDSGALITAEYGLKFGRKVFAVPGPITSTMSKGPYKLISRGAKLVTTTQDIISELGIPKESKIKNLELRIKRGDTQEENLILEILQNEPLPFDEIVRGSGFPSAKLGSLLSLMEVKGLIKSLAGGAYSI